jgi:hypothetical protein
MVNKDTIKLSPALLRNNDTYTSLLVLAFFSLGVVGIFNHEMWLDELQAWLIARDSSSIIELFKNLEYEGHPGLWHLSLYLITRFTLNPVAMQIFHLIIATGVIYVFAKLSPFTKLQKLLFTFGYFPFYEYSIISRNYAIGVLLLFGCCALLQIRKRNYILLAFILALLANTNLYGLIFAIAFVIGLLIEYLLQANRDRLLNYPKQVLILSILISLFGIFISIFQILPPPDASFSPGWTTGLQIKQLAKVLVTVGKAYAPLPNFFTYQFWNTTLLTAVKIIAAGIGTVFSLGLLVFTLIAFIEKPVVFSIYLTGTFGILSFMYFKYIGSLRHSGHLFILFIACLWISNYYTKSTMFLNPFARISPRVYRIIKNVNSLYASYQSKFIITILSLHVVAGIFAFTMDLNYPFSVTKEVARFIKNHRMENISVVGDVDYVNYIGPPLSAYLGKRVYYLGAHSSSLGSFLVWDGNRGKIRELNSYKFFENLSNYIKTKNQEILLVLNHELKDCKQNNNLLDSQGLKIDTFVDYCWPTQNYLVHKLSEFNNGLINDENPGFYLYLIQPHQNRQTSKT